jgi:hypothetical protein
MLQESNLNGHFKSIKIKSRPFSQLYIAAALLFIGTGVVLLNFMLAL